MSLAGSGLSSQPEVTRKQKNKAITTERNLKITRATEKPDYWLRMDAGVGPQIQVGD